MVVAAHPKITVTGTAPNLKLTLTNVDGDDIFESSGVYATLALAQVAARELEDSIRYALPFPEPVG